MVPETPLSLTSLHHVGAGPLTPFECLCVTESSIYFLHERLLGTPEDDVAEHPGDPLGRSLPPSDPVPLMHTGGGGTSTSR